MRRVICALAVLVTVSAVIATVALNTSLGWVIA